MLRFDVVIVGAGVAGSCIARVCTRYDLSVAVLEAGLDVADGATRANSGIVHAGYDPKPGSRKARYNVAGSKLYPRWAEELGFPFCRNGSLVLAFTPGELEAVRGLAVRGERNGVEGLRVVDAAELRAMEPNVSPDALGALLASTGGICDPYAVAFRAAEHAARNGATFLFDSRVTGIAAAPEGGYRLTVEHVRGGSREEVCARAVVNAAGVHADEVHDMVAPHAFSITPRRGEYHLLDAGTGSAFAHTMFQAPTAVGKGVLVTSTVYGNLLVGPNAVAQGDKDSTATSAEGLEGIVAAARKTYPALDMRERITTFAGVRATGDTGDFEIGEVAEAPGFFDVACFESPGLTSAPAVAEDIAGQVAMRLGAGANPCYDPVLKMPRLFKLLDEEGQRAAIAEDPAAGHIVCRCGEVTEADIVTALHTRLPVLCLDAVKWRTGAMMGRCHGGFCTPEVAKAVGRVTGIAPDELPKRFFGSHVVAAAPTGYAELAAEERVFGRAAADYDVAVVGGGAAGIAAAAAAAREGARVALVDREPQQGGILKQCIHNGFGLHRFGEELTGPEYASRELGGLAGLAVDVLPGTSVMAVEQGDGALELATVSPAGEARVAARSVVLATGSRERGAGALGTPGTRPAGVFSAGSAQNFMNLQGCLPGHEAVILGSGDIGLIMARRLTLAGAHVAGVFEIKPEPGGLRRNIVQCLDDFGIPLFTSTTVVAIEGKAQLEAVVVAQVDGRGRPIAGTERRVPCDTLLLSVGLIPENVLARDAGVELDPVTGGAVVDDCLETSVPGIFACGNALHVHDLVDFVSEEGARAGRFAARHALGRGGEDDVAVLPVRAGDGVRYVVPQRLHADADCATLRFRTTASFGRADIVVEARDASFGRVLLKRKRVPVAIPAEMQTVELKGLSLGDAIEVSVRMEGADA